MRSPVDYLLMNLAVADTTVVLFITPQHILHPLFKHPEGRLGNFLCKVLTGGTLSWVGLASSVFTLVSIAVERYHSILFPHNRYGRRTSVKAQFAIAMSWLVALVSEIPSIAVIKYKGQHKVCIEDWPDIHQARTYTAIAFFLDFLVPFVVMSALYGRVIRRLWNHRISHGNQVALVRRRKRVTKILAIVTLLHGVCLLPDALVYFLSYCSFKYSSITFKISTVFVCLNSTINPFLYSLHSQRFRQSLRRLLCGKRRRTGRLVTKTEGVARHRFPSLRRLQTSDLLLH